jgi:Rod binding domain-containing protein
MNIVPVTSSTASEQPKPKNIGEAAKQFEAILIAQMLRSVQESSENQDSTSGTMLDLAGQHFAQVLADSGGLGLSKVIVKGLQSR